MDCRNTQRLLDDLAAGRLARRQADEAQRHLAECTDCRVAQQRTLRLQQLLAVKQHETPGAQYFDNFLDQFHRRLAVELAPKSTIWDRLFAHFTIEPVRTWKFGLAAALGVFFVFNLAMNHFTVVSESGNSAAMASSIPVEATIQTPQSLPATAVAAFVPRPSAPSSADNVVIIPSAVRADDNPSAPRYVLDRIGITPASYDASDIHF